MIVWSYVLVIDIRYSRVVSRPRYPGCVGREAKNVPVDDSRMVISTLLVVVICTLSIPPRLRTQHLKPTEPDDVVVILEVSK